MSVLNSANSYSSCSEDATSFYLQPFNFYLSKSESIPPLSAFRLEIPEKLQWRVTEAYTRTSSASPSLPTTQTPSAQPLVGTLTLGANSVISDVSGTVRSVFDGAHKVFGAPSPAALAPLGATSGFNVISGSLNVWNGIKEIKTAEKTSDTAGKVLGVATVGRGSAFATGGATFVPVRALTVAGLFTTSKIVTTLASILGKAGTSLFAIGYVFVGMGLGIRLNEHRQFRQQLFAILNDTSLDEPARAVKALEHLKSRATITPEEKSKISEGLQADESFRALTPDEQVQLRTDKEKLLIQKKETFLKRVLNDDCLKLIREKGPAEAAEVIAAVKKKSLEKTVLASVSMALASVSLVLSVASFLTTSPITITVLAALSIAMAIGWLAVDTYGLIQEYIKSDPGRFDKLWLFLSTVIATIAASVAFYTSGGMAFIFGASVVGTAWVGINAICYRRIQQLWTQKMQQIQ